MELILFEQNSQRFALYASVVKEILSPSSITPVPYAPCYVDGLINAAGSVIMQIDLGQRMEISKEKIPPHSGHIIIVGQGANAYALHVEKVISKIVCENSEVLLTIYEKEHVKEHHEDGSSKVGVKGEIHLNGEILLLLDEDYLGLNELSRTVEFEKDEGMLGSVIEMHKDEKKESEQSCLVVRSGGEYFGFFLDDVLEIVEIESITPIPHGPHEARGFYLLRDCALLTLSLACLFQKEEKNDEVFGIVIKASQYRIVLLIESLIGIHKFSKNDIQKPSVNEGDIEGWIRGANDEMIGLLSCKSFFSSEKLENYEHFLIEDTEKLNKEETQKTQRMLSFWIENEKCGLPLDTISRVTESTNITELPKTDEIIFDEKSSDYVLGVIQIQGIVMPLLNSSQILKKHINQSNQNHFIVIEHDESFLALAVDRVDRVIELPEHDIENVKNDNHFITGIGKIEGKLMSILSLKNLQLSQKV